MFRKLGLVLAFAVLCTGLFFAGDTENAAAQTAAATPTPTPSATPPPIIDDEVLKIATTGKGAMPPKGGSSASDGEFKAAVEYLVNSAK